MDAEKMSRRNLTVHQLRYIVNSVWLPRLQYRTQLNSSLKMAQHVDRLVRKLAKTVLRLPHGTPSEIFYDRRQGIGLTNFTDACNAGRVQLALRVLNTSHIPAHHLLVEALEDYQVLAGLTDHPLEAPISPPAHLQGWTHRTIRAAAKLGIKTKSQWTMPVACTSSRPNDRPVWSHLEPHEQQLLIAYNVQVVDKIRFVGDIASVRGTHVLTNAELTRQRGWRRKQSRHFAKLEPLLLLRLCEDGVRRLRQPTGRTVHAAVHGAMRPVAIPPGAFFVVSQFVVADDGLVLTGYEVGQRVGDAIHVNPHGLGTEIDVQWWHERARTPGVLTRRPEGRLTEFVDVCVPITVTPIGRERIIVWTTTSVGGRRGLMDRGLIGVSFQRSVDRYQQIVSTGRLTEERRECTACHRLNGSTHCPQCNEWHHTNCVVCRRDPVGPPRSSWGVYRDERPCAADEGPVGGGALSQLAQGWRAGDDSVLHGGSPSATGGWGVMAVAGSRQGRTAVHWADITSTRMELHALIMGMVMGGDGGTQICDNQAALLIFAKARDIVEGRCAGVIKYSNKHRVELRSLIKLMNRGGRCTGHWVRSHQEEEPTDDMELQLHRNLLASADALAGGSHQGPMVQSYASVMAWDCTHLVDSAGAPILGSTYQYLQRAGDELRHERWMVKQRTKGSSRQTASRLAVALISAMNWSDHEARFYWQTITNSLHTNAKKHRIHKEWSPDCRLCPRRDGTARPADTQAHRFGIDGQACPGLAMLIANRNAAWATVIAADREPDREVFLPGRDHDLAARSGRPTRGLWTIAGQHNCTWKPMINLVGDTWVHARQLVLLVSSSAYHHYANTLLRQDNAYRPTTLSGCLLPRYIQQAVLRCAGTAAVVHYHPSQANGTWASGVLADGYPVVREALNVQQPPQHQRVWWLDDTYRPLCDETWHSIVRRALPGRREGEALWLACYEDSVCYDKAQALGAEWYVKIPSGTVDMRTAQAVYQTRTTPRSATISRNPATIWIGVVTDSIAHVDHHGWIRVFASAFAHADTNAWIVPEQHEHPRPWRPPLECVMDWTADPAALDGDPTVQKNAVWVRERWTGVYGAPSGWKTWPTMTEETKAWSQVWTNTKSSAKRLHRTLFTRLWVAIKQKRPVAG